MHQDRLWKPFLIHPSPKGNMGIHGIYCRQAMSGTVQTAGGGTSAAATATATARKFLCFAQNHPIYSGGSTGLTDFFGIIVKPSISQRNCCGVRECTCSGLRGHWKRPSASLLYNRSHPSPSHTSPLIRSVRRPQKR